MASDAEYSVSKHRLLGLVLSRSGAGMVYVGNAIQLIGFLLAWVDPFGFGHTSGLFLVPDLVLGIPLMVLGVPVHLLARLADPSLRRSPVVLGFAGGGLTFALALFLALRG